MATSFLEIYWKSAIHYRLELRSAFRQTALYQSSASIWHDGLEAILRVPTEHEPASAEMKKDALRVWRTFGSHMDFSEYKRPVDTSRPSDLSNERVYWRIERRCFWRKCACAIHAAHSLRVCKGCWRVLYCNAVCQSK